VHGHERPAITQHSTDPEAKLFHHQIKYYWGESTGGPRRVYSQVSSCMVANVTAGENNGPQRLVYKNPIQTSGADQATPTHVVAWGYRANACLRTASSYGMQHMPDPAAGAYQLMGHMFTRIVVLIHDTCSCKLC